MENLQGLTTLKVYQADGFKQDQMNEQAEKFRRITMRVLTMQLNSITMRELFCARFVKRGAGRTVLLVSHRPSTMRITDTVVPVERGRMS